MTDVAGVDYTGTAGRMRSWLLAVVSGEVDWMPAELTSKLRLVEGELPFLCRMLKVPGVRSFADLLPDNDEEAGRLLALLHAWSAEMLAGSPAGESSGGTPGDLNLAERTGLEP